MRPSSSQSTQSEHNDKDHDDPSISHLVSGSDYDVYLSDDRLMHESWYDEHGEEKGNSSNEDDEAEDIDCSYFSDSDNGGYGDDSEMYYSE